MALYDANGKKLAWFFNDNTGANARLIAAAPDLLAELKDCLDILERRGVDSTKAHRIRTIIAKATNHE